MLTTTKLKDTRLSVFIVCTGLGHINRGYESFTRELFDAIHTSGHFRYFLFKGGGVSQPEKREYTLPNIPRNSRLGRYFGHRAYQFEQASFACSLLLMVLLHRPAVILYSDATLGDYMNRFRKRLPRRWYYRLLYSNGAPNDPPYLADLTQQLLPYFVRRSVELGYSTDRMAVVPYGFALPATYEPVDKRILRQTLKIPADVSLILSVGAVNRSHKRMDYLIESVHKLGRPDVFLLILGELEKESEEVLALGRQLLGDRFEHRRVASQAVSDYYRAADIFTLASLREGFGRAIIEALGLGLPILVHDYDIPRELMADYGYYADFTKEHGLSSLLANVLNLPYDPEAAARRSRYAYQRYGWPNIMPDYVNLIRHVIDLPE